MKHLGVEIEVKNKPALDEGFIPVLKYNCVLFALRATTKHAQKTIPFMVFCAMKGMVIK